MTILNEILSPIFIRILINSCNASILIFAIFIIRIIFNNKINIRTHYLIWFILIARLILPFDFNISNFLNFNKIPKIQFDYSSLNNFESITINQNIKVSNPLSSFMNILTLLWLLLIILFLIKRIIVLMVFLKNLKNEKEISDKKTLSIFDCCIRNLKLKKMIKIIETDLIKSPCVFGIFKYRILFPKKLLTNLNHSEIKCIFFHELSHIKNKDTIIEIITHLLKIIYFFNPLVAFALNEMVKDSEYLSDEDTISLTGNDFFTYGNTLIKIIVNMKSLKLSKYIQGIFSLLAAVNNKKHIKRRLKMICNTTKGSVITSILSVFILTIVFVLTFTGPVFAEMKNKDAEINFINPLNSSKISSKFGKGIDQITKQERFHNGIDLAKKTGTPVKASCEGTVVKVEENSQNETGYGKYIIIAHDGGYTTLYAKLNKIQVKENQQLKTGVVIGLVGSTGRSTGPHLHFEIRKDGKSLNPEDFINFK